MTLLLLLVACEATDPCPEQSMLDGPEGLALTEDEHGIGWGRSDCWECHHVETLHRTGCTPDVDLQAIQATVDDQGLASCATCHGDNGVSP